MSPALIKSILDTAITIFASDELLPRAAFEKLAREAIASSDGNYSIQEAVKWAEGFEFLQEFFDSD
jgi:histone H3/H4